MMILLVGDFLDFGCPPTHEAYFFSRAEDAAEIVAGLATKTR
jgi:hypothetical protein